MKGKLANGVGSQYSHATSERGLSSITQADAHTSAASSRLNWRPNWFKWTRLFRRKTKSGFSACAITFRTSYIKYRIWINTFPLLYVHRYHFLCSGYTPRGEIVNRCLYGCCDVTLTNTFIRSESVLRAGLQIKKNNVCAILNQTRRVAVDYAKPKKKEAWFYLQVYSTSAHWED